MKLLTVLLISLAALACTEANPNQIRNNNVGDITAIRIDINGKITSVINQVNSESRRGELTVDQQLEM